MQRRIQGAVAKVATLVVGAVALAACGGDDYGGNGQAASGTPAKKKSATVTLWTMPNSPDPQKDLEALLAPFTQETGTKVKVHVVGWDVQLDRIRNAAVSGQGPDVTQAGTTQVPFLAALGGFENVGDRIAQVGGAEAYAPGVYQTTQLVGQVSAWAMPWFTEARAINYRKDVLEKAGVDPKTAWTTWACSTSARSG